MCTPALDAQNFLLLDRVVEDEHFAFEAPDADAAVSWRNVQALNVRAKGQREMVDLVQACKRIVLRVRRLGECEEMDGEGAVAAGGEQVREFLSRELRTLTAVDYLEGGYGFFIVDEGKVGRGGDGSAGRYCHRGQEVDGE